MSNCQVFMFKKVDSKVNFPKMEEKILKFWDEEKIFERSVEKNPADKHFIFYEGPPTANGRPGLHHVLARAFKDIIPRYKTMQGYRVERKAGWDTHGLPVELQVEKALGLKNKQDIENIVPGDARASIIAFNQQCKESVWEYRDLWEKMTKRMGYWVDMEHPYVTYENEYIESVWWQLAQIAELKNDRGENFLYKGHKVVPYCYRCGTTLSSHEVAQGYKDVKDLAVVAKFELADEPGTFILAWTTTPWTLPGNVALAVGSDVAYVKVESYLGEDKKEKYILAKNIFEKAFKNEGGGFKEFASNGVILQEMEGKELEGKSYKPLFDYYAHDEKLENRENGWKIYAGNFVTTEEGTGVVHIASAFGEDDMELGKKVSLPFVQHVSMDGMMKDEARDFAGMFVKPTDNPQATDVEMIKYLARNGLLFSKEKYEHSYPHCWRCDTPLLNYAMSSWSLRMSEVRGALVENNEKITWVPEHIKEGRFGEWLFGVRDWAISRERYWGTPLPIWECAGAELTKEGCGKIKIIASIAELEKLSGIQLADVHKPYIDDVTFACGCGGTMKRTPEVLDVWFDSGAMPLAQFAYPHKADVTVKKNIEAGEYFPADYICEAVDQTRGWFYTLHALATLLHTAGKIPAGNAYKNAICLGHILDAQGKKMSKSRGNVIDPFEMFDQFGADQLRWFLFSINQPGLPKRFDLKGMRDVQNRVFRMLWNSYSFFMTYAAIDKWEPKEHAVPSKNILDIWIISELQMLVKEVDEALAQYDVYFSTKKIESFIDHLSNWYIRRSRKRFWKSEDDDDKENAYQALYDVLVTLAKVMAPFTPFLSEEIYRNLINEESVHLADWPTVQDALIDEKLNEEMQNVRNLVTEGLKVRADAKIKVRQPLGASRIKNQELRGEFLEILKEELNVKNIIADVALESAIVLDTEVTPELKLEGEAREIIRAIQEGRKKAGFNVEDRILLGYQGKEKVFENAELKAMIQKEVLATSIARDALVDATYTETVTLEGETFIFFLKKV